MVNVVVCWVLTGVTWDVPGIAGKKKRLTLLAVLLGDQRHFFQRCCWLLEDVIQCRRVKATCGSPRNLSIPSLLFREIRTHLFCQQCSPEVSTGYPCAIHFI